MLDDAPLLYLKRRTHGSMLAMAIAPLDDLRPQPHIAALPRADLHLRQEGSPRLDRVLARRDGREPYDWRAWATTLMRRTPQDAAGRRRTPQDAAGHRAAGPRRPRAYDPRLLELIGERGVTVECCLGCNVVLGAATSYEEHPFRRSMEQGIPVALGTDDPMQVCTTIGREYAMAAALGFSPAELLGFASNAVRASFLPPECKAVLLAELSAWDADAIGV
jgi:hypothetical protein